MLHKMVCGYLKGFLHALADSDTRHDDNELTPAVLLVQLEHGLDVDIGLACAGFHLNIKAAPAHALDERGRQLDIVRVLLFVDIRKQLFIGKLHILVLETGFAVYIVVLLAEIHLLVRLFLKQGELRLFLGAERE